MIFSVNFEAATELRAHLRMSPILFVSTANTAVGRAVIHIMACGGSFYEIGIPGGNVRQSKYAHNTVVLISIRLKWAILSLSRISLHVATFFRLVKKDINYRLELLDTLSP